jgi:hypothetical protein
MILDGVAAFKFLFEGHSTHFIAVIKAHFSFYGHLPSTLKKRREMRQMRGFMDSTTGVYEKNIVYAHFIKSINYYSDLK